MFQAHTLRKKATRIPPPKIGIDGNDLGKKKKIEQKRQKKNEFSVSEASPCMASC
jgi:hypothetical protein